MKTEAAHPVLTALPLPTAAVGFHVEHGVPWPLLKLIYETAMPKTVREWYAFLGSARAYWWVLLGDHRHDRNRRLISINAVERKGRPDQLGSVFHSLRPLFAATFTAPRFTVDAFQSEIEKRDRILLCLLDPVWRYDLTILFRESRAFCKGVARRSDFPSGKIIGSGTHIGPPGTNL